MVSVVGPITAERTGCSNYKLLYMLDRDIRRGRPKSKHRDPLEDDRLDLRRLWMIWVSIV